MTALTADTACYASACEFATHLHVKSDDCSEPTALDRCAARSMARVTGSVGSRYTGLDGVEHVYFRNGDVESCTVCAPAAPLTVEITVDLEVAEEVRLHARRVAGRNTAKAALKAAEARTAVVLAALPLEARKALEAALDAEVDALLDLGDAHRFLGNDDREKDAAGQRTALVRMMRAL